MVGVVTAAALTVASGARHWRGGVVEQHPGQLPLETAGFRHAALW
ncbi:MAG: hypothetical protein R2851_02275 [Caldilineaceae bacterium]